MNKSNESNFEFFNPNPTAKKPFKNGRIPQWNKPDCVIRAFSGATGMSWIDSYNILCEKGKEMFDVPSSMAVLDASLLSVGFKKVSLSRPKKGEKRPTVAKLAETLKNQRCLFSVAGHVVSAHDGKYFDTWDCGASAVYTYYIK